MLKNVHILQDEYAIKEEAGNILINVTPVIKEATATISK